VEYERDHKLPLCARAGVSEIWLLTFPRDGFVRASRDLLGATRDRGLRLAAILRREPTKFPPD
jgi:hypothetical protein